MPEKLRWYTVSDSLAEVLKKLIELPELDDFRLVGGTALSLMLGHRESFDIDLFTDAEYDSIDYSAIERIIKQNFICVDRDAGMDLTGGITRRIGMKADELVKVDLYYTDTFIRKELIHEGLRMADIVDIAAMKLDVISTTGRKRDFWDLHEFLDMYSLFDLLALYREKYPYGSEQDVLTGLTDFAEADNQIDPVCLLGKFWDLIKLDIIEVVEEYRASK